MTIARVIGLGQRAAGDDGVGLAVLERLRGVVAEGVELVELAEPCALVPVLAGALPAVIVDAVVADRAVPGEILELDSDAVPVHARSTSTHGIGLAQALALARALAAPGAAMPAVRIVGVAIAVPAVPAIGLSPAIARAVEPAVEAVLRALHELARPSPPCVGRATAAG